MTKPIRFGIIGGGWRATCYLKLARMLPQQFQVSGLLIRNPDKYHNLISEWKLPVYSSLEDLAADSDFVVLAVSKASAVSLLQKIAALNIPVLAETPTASTLEEVDILRTIAGDNSAIQVAEQYPLQPHHQARTAYIQSGNLGQVCHVQVSAAHGYHGISLIRKWLSIFEVTCEIVARRLQVPIMDFSYRGEHARNIVTTEQQDIAIMTFPSGKSAVLDFTRSQYFSPLRSNRILIRGSHGEIRDNDIIRYIGPTETEALQIRRLQGGQEGSLDSLSLYEIRTGQHCLFHNPFHPSPLSDEEIAMGQALLNMSKYLETGISTYSLSDALIDTKLSLAIEEAIALGSVVTL